jgi:FkbM family methyltransferase
MRIRLGDWLGRHVYVLGEYEPATAHVLRALLRPAGRLVDVGANVGYFTLLASRAVGPKGKVYAFEPVPQTLEDLRHNLRLNGAENVVVGEEALADQPGEATFFVGPADHRGTSSLRSLTGGEGVLKVRRLRLDDWLPAGEHVDVIKLDVEGAEYLALRGMEAILRRDRPDLVIEITDSFLQEMGASAAAVHAFLSGLGYRMYVIEPDGLRPSSGHERLPAQYNALFTARPAFPPGLAVLPAADAHLSTVPLPAGAAGG